MIKPDDISDKLDSTLDLVKTDVAKANERPSSGEVMYVSDECQLVKVGDKVHFNAYAGLEIDNPNGSVRLIGARSKKWLIMMEAEIMLITERKVEEDADSQTV